jgi:PAS domain S-box-containing protein
MRAVGSAKFSPFTRRERCITARKRERQKKYRVLAKTLPEGVLITDKQGTLTCVNPALEQMFGIPSTASLGTDFRTYITSESVRIADEAFLGCAQGKTVREVELQAVHGDRHVFPIEIVASPIFKAGEFQGVESVVRDITARKQAEAAEPRAEEHAPLRVLLADDHEITREGLLALLQDEHSVEVMGEAANGREAVALAEELGPDVVVMDVSMPLMGGNEATRRIKAQRPQTRVIALSMYDEPAMMEQMHQAGAESYVIKTAPTDELLAAIRGEKPDAEPAAGNR